MPGERRGKKEKGESAKETKGNRKEQVCVQDEKLSGVASTGIVDHI